MKNIHSILIVCLLLTTAASAATTHPATKPALPGPQITRLTLHPMPTTRPALQYELLPNVADQTPGNAAQLYLMATEMGSDEIARIPATGPSQSQYDRIWDYLKLPPDQLPSHEIKEILQKYNYALRYLDLAAHRDYCRWDLPFYQEGYKLILPYLNPMMSMFLLVELQAKWTIAQSDWPAALHSLQIGLAMTRDLNNQPMLVQALVATVNAERMLDRVNEWVTRPHSPNLYWPLSDLPHPFIDSQRAMRWSSAEFYFSIPLLNQARHGDLTSDQWRRMERDVWDVLKFLSTINGSPPFPGGKLTFEQYIAMAQPHAKAWLIAVGRPKQEVEEMDAYRAVGNYWFDTYRDWSDELRKGWGLPYWQMAGQMDQSDRQFRAAKEKNQSDLILQLISSVDGARRRFAQLDRHIALLRTVEALRDYAARHDGQPPASLSDIQNLPIPIDPMTGKPFIYHATGRSAVLEAPAPPHYPYEARRYELSFK